jgi:hypothetical protein
MDGVMKMNVNAITNAVILAFSVIISLHFVALIRSMWMNSSAYHSSFTSSAQGSQCRERSLIPSSNPPCLYLLDVDGLEELQGAFIPWDI